MINSNQILGLNGMDGNNGHFLSGFNGATVVVTGHTGFKGTWLIAWLKRLGANVVGISLDPSTTPSHFNAYNFNTEIVDSRVNICDKVALRNEIISVQPDFVFHLAAQALVRRSYEDPLETWQTNVMGTLNLLEALRDLDKQCSAVIITSDKCYDNVEWVWGYRETDTLGGPDPYSASKGAAELAIRSHVKSFFSSPGCTVRVASARAGNVIGGGDWSADRIIPDCVRAWASLEAVDLRKPHATRPWQHVLEPLSGYLSLAIELSRHPELHGESFNFGPQSERNHTVLSLVREMAIHWDKVRWQDASIDELGPYESGLLKLNCDKALHYLDWHAVMDFKTTVAMTAEWYRTFYQGAVDIRSKTDSQISEYMQIAAQRGMKWAH